MVADQYPNGFGNTDVITDPSKRQAFFDFCRTPHGDASQAIRRVYLAAGWHGLDRVSADDQQLKQFIRQGHALGIQVFSLQGYHGWVTPSGQGHATSVIENVLRFNRGAAPEERFDGIILDIEPNTLSQAQGHELDWKQDQPQIWRLYLGVLDEIVDQVKQYNRTHQPPILLGECIPDYYADRPKPGMASFRDVMDRVDFVWLMCYRDRLNTIVKMSKDEIRYASKIDKPIVLGLCVNQPNADLWVTPHNTFWDDGHRTIERTIRSLRQRYRAQTQLRELSVFSYIHYRQMPR